ncbi:hypothetical protein P1J78_17285 [Psychromarinibacter sp. C21-152]|uniref:Ferredoxin n=1 Tax=Psychromarinibacter sediminicola TaxID=3033385 RepID=A0AAE3NUB2_9RHOB|nr:hypothetical protein [Psychromarinibacter sediminicola]MDF0602494.1 hypothetical protein [Psychromarinibacter sediminicola]
MTTDAGRALAQGSTAAAWAELQMGEVSGMSGPGLDRARVFVTDAVGGLGCALADGVAADGALEPPAPDEADTIEFMAHEPTEASRLPCQITVTPQLAGAVFRVATGRGHDLLEDRARQDFLENPAKSKSSGRF